MGKFEHNTGTTRRIHFPLGVFLLPNYKSQNTTTPTVNIMLIYFFYQILLILGDSILLGGFELGDDLLDVSSAYTKNQGYISDGNLFLDHRHE